MRRREFIAFLIGATAVSMRSPTRAQQRAKARRIGYILPAEARTPLDQVFEISMQELGWIIGQSIKIEYRYTGAQPDKDAAIVAEIAGLDLDLVVAWGPTLPLAAMKAMPQRPVVFLMGFDPIRLGLVSNFAQPGGNVTGITSLASVQIAAKRLELLKEAVPSLARAAVVYSTERSRTSAGEDALERAASSLGIKLDEFEVATPTELEGAMRRARDRGAQALYVWQNGFAHTFAKEIADTANAQNLPSIHPFREGALSGCLLTYGADLRELVRHGAAYVDKILRGAHPGSLPVEQMSKYELLINLKTATLLGLTIPPTLLARADEVIE